jgi:hypothetical protein
MLEMAAARVLSRVPFQLMHSALRSLFVITLALAGVLVLHSTAAAAPSPVGYDVSHPQCDSELPRRPAFVIVGVNGGLATRTNPCLADQLTWAWRSTGSVTAQPRVQLYLNTANPGEVRDQVTTWPTDGSTPYGSCDGSNSTACSWEYGWQRAENSVLSFFTPAARGARVDSLPARYVWWLDVETMNTWQSGSDEALARNRAALEGMTAYLDSRDAEVGIYSTHQQWDEIVGDVPRSSALAGRDSWLAGSSSLSDAVTDCRQPPLVPGGRVVLTQYVPDDLDRDHSCDRTYR